VLLLPNPFDPMGVPPAFPLRYASFMYFFLLLMQAAFSFRPRLLLWTGLCGAGAWTMGFLWIVTRPQTITDPPGRAGQAAMLASYLDPNYASVLKYQNEIIAFLLVSAGLALLVRRSRTLVAERAEAERARGNLARYFSPKVVDVLAERDEPLGRVRRQAVGVLFADLVGFTTMAEDMTPEEVMALLRAFHGRMEDEVFRHGGCLEKFIGDALLATFGVPDVGRRDATDTLACARGMLAALKAWNAERGAAGQPPLGMGLACTTDRWCWVTSAAPAAWPSPPSATPPTSPAACRR
jgi:adenylate cyclase